MEDSQDAQSVGAGKTEPEMKAICEQLIVRMGADPSMAPRGRVPVEFHQVGKQRVFPCATVRSTQQMRSSVAS